MKFITLLNGKKAMVDDVDFDSVNCFDWSFHTGYAARRVGSARNKTSKWIFMAREIAQPPAGFEVDHRDRNKLNNTRKNLRICTSSQNSCNIVKRGGNRTGFIGVRKARARFAAQIQLNGKVTHLGTFDSPKEAAIAYDKAAFAKAGEYAVLNFPTKTNSAAPAL